MKENNLFYSSIYKLKLQNFPTYLNDFQQISKRVDDSINFKSLFKSFYNFMQHFDETLENEINPDKFLTISSQEDLKLIDMKIKNLIEINLSKIEAECPSIFFKEWNVLNTYFNGKTKIHTVLSLIMLYNDIEIIHKQINEYEKNILYWALLLHDIAKHVILNDKLGEMFDIKDSRDQTHPFKSGAVTLKLFLNLNLFKSKDEDEELTEKINRIYALLVNSVELEKLENKEKPTYIHSHQFLEVILEDLWSITQLNSDNQWLIDVFILVIFHQSLPNIKQHMNKVLLEEKYVKEIFDLRLLELMRIVMVNDSASHTLFGGEVFAEEINESLNSVREYLLK